LRQGYVEKNSVTVQEVLFPKAKRKSLLKSRKERKIGE